MAECCWTCASWVADEELRDGSCVRCAPEPAPPKEVPVADRWQTFLDRLVDQHGVLPPTTEELEELFDRWGHLDDKTRWLRLLQLIPTVSVPVSA